MFIGICGSICAGKSTVARYLVDHHGFKRLSIASASPVSAHCAEGQDRTIGLKSQHDDAEPPDPSAPRNGTRRSETARRLPIHSAHTPLSFPTASDLLDFVTKSWRERWVTTDICSEAVLDTFSRRPFFLLISVDAPLTVRWHRYQDRCASPDCPSDPTASRSAITLETFVALSDAYLYDAATGKLPLLSRASVRLLNTSSSVAHLFATLGKVDVLNEDRLRPSWDTYFMALASLAAQRSNCMKRRVGCVVVRDKRVVSTGYNGTPRGLRNCGEGGCARCNAGEGAGHGLATCLCIHAEENALLEAGRERVREGAVLYCDTCPCLTCSIKIVQVGIGEVVYSQGYSMDTETAAVFREAGVKLRQFVPAGDPIFLAKRGLC